MGKAGSLESRNVKDRRQADILISAAGPISNILASLGFLLLIGFFRLYVRAEASFLGSAVEPLYLMCTLGVQLNVILAVFNLLPIPPLDGSWILPHFLPSALASGYEKLRPYGIYDFTIVYDVGVFQVVLFRF
jgi:Zn-dependent protease